MKSERCQLASPKNSVSNKANLQEEIGMCFVITNVRKAFSYYCIFVCFFKRLEKKTTPKGGH